MIARVLTLRCRPENVEALARICREEYVGVFERMEGFRGGSWLADAASGKVMQITCWASEAAIQGMIDSLARQALERRVMPLMDPSVAPTFENFAVAAQTQARGADAHIARVHTVRVRPGALDALVLLTRESYAPVFDRMAGYCGGMWGVNPATNGAFQVTLWDSEAAIRGMIDDETRATLDRQVYPLLDAEPEAAFENFAVMAWARN